MLASLCYPVLKLWDVAIRYGLMNVQQKGHRRSDGLHFWLSRDYFAGLVLLQVSATFFTDCTVNGVAAAAPAAFDEDAWSDD